MAKTVVDHFIEWGDLLFGHRAVATAPPIQSTGHDIELGVVIRALRGVFDQFGIGAKTVGYVRGAAVTLFYIELLPGVEVEKVERRIKNIRMELGKDRVRLLSVIPGKRGVMGLEVPNDTRDMVLLTDLLSSLPDGDPLDWPLGVGVIGGIVVRNIRDFPHVLIAGATQSGKSNALNSLLVTLLARAAPDQVRLILIDLKRVELMPYSNVPHLLMPVITNSKKALDALGWLKNEFEQRIELMELEGVRNSQAYNAKMRAVDKPTWPDLLCVIDEFALLKAAGKAGAERGDPVDEAVAEIAAVGRAVGIYLVLATQRPEVAVISGLIKANVPTRIAFAVSGQQDSRVILDSVGAEDLLGKGDGLLSTGAVGMVRFQSAYVDDETVQLAVAHAIREFGGSHDLVDPTPASESPATAESLPDWMDEDDAGDDPKLYAQARELVITSQFGSTSMLQRKMRIGFAKAGRLMDLLEANGVVGSADGSKAREVLVKPDAT